MRLKEMLAFAVMITSQFAIKAQVPNNNFPVVKSQPEAAAPKPKKEEKLKELPDPEKISWRQSVTFGDKLFEMGSLYNGLHYYEVALQKNPGKIELITKLAAGNFALRDYKAANKYYKMLVDADTSKHNNFYALYYYGLTDKYLGNYEKAKLTFEQFNNLAKNIKELDEQRNKATVESQGCDLGIRLREDKGYKEVRITHLDTNINQPFTDYSPILRDNTLYFGAWVSDSVILVGKREKYATFSKIYSSKRVGKTNTWTKAQAVAGDVNAQNFHVGNSTFTADGKTMYYTQCLQDEQSRMRCNIYKSILGDSGWVAGIKLLGNINVDGATNTEPSLGKNESGEDVIYFASDRNKDKGLDLFYARINADGTVDKAKEVPGVNTNGDEMTPYYDYQSKTLYFSSNGRVNIGGLDVFKTQVMNGSWSTPENMGLPINSSVDDMYYNWSEKDALGFVVSNRPGGYGLKSETCCDDIYEVYIHKIWLAVKGTLVNADTASQLLMNQTVTLFDANTGAVVKTYNSTNGSYFFDLEPDKSYKISAVRDGFFTGVQTFNTNGRDNSDTMIYTLSLKRMEKNKAYSLNNIYYEYDKADLTPASKNVLDTLFEILKENPNIVIELSAHTDSKGADKYNMDLSQKRAESCVNYLVGEKGIPKERIVAKGYGKTMPVAPNTKPDGSDNPDGRAKNRRTEFKIIDELKKSAPPATN